MTQKTKDKVEKKRSESKLLDTISKMDNKDKLFEFPSTPIIMTPIPESPMPSIQSLNRRNNHKKQSKSSIEILSSSIGKRNNNKHKRRRRKKKRILNKNRYLADPYNEEWNGLDPDNYIWYDNVPEGECYDDKELSLRNRRIQYLVVMAIENQYCTISDLTYKQNELLLLYQQSLIF